MKKPLVYGILSLLLLSLITGQIAPRQVSTASGLSVEDLLAQMTLDEKIGQMTLVEKNSIYPPDITALSIGGILSGGGGHPSKNTVEEWAAMVDGFQDYALDTRLAIPMIYGVDAVHGHGNLEGATLFPHNVGLGATHNPELVEQVCRATAEEMIATGIYWNYAPVIAVPQDVRWGRTYEGYSENTELVTALGTACIAGLQGDNLSDPTSVLATPKHFIGDGGTKWGTSVTGNYQIDQGDMQVDEATLREVFLPPYQAAVEAGAMSIMISFSGWNGTRLHAQKYLITDVLKGELGFQGFVVSDWGGIDQIDPFDYYTSVVTSINAGVDMNMVPYDYYRFIKTMQDAVENGDIPMERIDDAVRRILTVKMDMGLFEHPYSQAAMMETVGSQAHRDLARQAVSESLVLLKNENAALPLAKDAPMIIVAGEAADDIGTQAGGWTIQWQGLTGDITEGTTILEAIESSVSNPDNVQYDRLARFRNIADDVIADIGIVVIGEKPYAEGLGDSATLALDNIDIGLVERVRERSRILIVILLSGRPVVIADQLAQADAFVAAWLPGTEGQGVTDVLFGDKDFTGTLPYTWLRSIDQLPFDFANLPTEGCDAPLFPFGYGLNYSGTQTPIADTCQ